jgi:hypothetical protein
MSHIVTVSTRIRDPDALAAACRRLGLEAPVSGTAAVFQTQESGLIVKLPGWTYPVVMNPASGEIRYDNFGGTWGHQSELDRLLQAYAIEKARIEARRAGHGVLEQQLPNGSIKLTISVGGGT